MLSVAGIGVGGGLTIEATATDTYTVDERCIEVVTRARVASAEIRVLLNGVEVDRHPRR
jgi:hypothetical protein